MSRPKNDARLPESELATSHLVADIGRRSRRGGALLLGAQAVRVLGQMATLVVLARLLPPSAFGLLAMVAAVGLVLEFLKELGLSAATIQKSGLTQAQVSALFWINTAAGLLLAAGLALAAPMLAHFYDQPELGPIARWLALGFALSGLTVQHWALLRRQMRFAAIAGLETAADYASFAAAITLALAGEGYWALVVQRLVSPAILLVGSWAICRWRPSWPAPAEGLRELLRFGASVTVSGMASALVRSIDQILIGWMWGAALLGLYERTSRLLLLPVTTINAPIYAAAMPALSRLANQPERYRRMFRQIMQKVGLLTMPAFAVAAVNADWVVEVLFGPSWRDAVPLAALFSVSATYLPALLAVGLLYLTQGRTGEMLRATLIDAALCLIAILVGLQWGAVGVAASLSIVGLVGRTPVAFWLATLRGPVSVAETWRAVAPAISAALAAAAAAWAVRAILMPGLSAQAVAAVGGASLLAVTSMLLMWPETRQELCSGAHRVAVFVRRRRAVLEP